MRQPVVDHKVVGSAVKCSCRRYTLLNVPTVTYTLLNVACTIYTVQYTRQSVPVNSLKPAGGVMKFDLWIFLNDTMVLPACSNSLLVTDAVKAHAITQRLLEYRTAHQPLLVHLGCLVILAVGHSLCNTESVWLTVWLAGLLLLTGYSCYLVSLPGYSLGRLVSRCLTSLSLPGYFLAISRLSSG